MFYTLLKFLGWGSLLAFIGGCIGWALRALKARNDLARTRSTMVEADEADHVRHLVADLEQVVAERDRLRIQLADVRHVDSPGIVGADVPPPDAPDPDAYRSTGPDEEPSDVADGSDTSENSADEASEESSEEPSPTIDPDGPDEPVTDEPVTDEPVTGEPVTDEPVLLPPTATDADPESDLDLDPDPDLDLDLDAARAVLGKSVMLDDLTVVEGIGPKISELCSGVGVTTWRQLADTDVSELQSILDAAGSRYSVHKPATWSHQAELLATGRWSEFRAFTEELKRGR